MRVIREIPWIKISLSYHSHVQTHIYTQNTWLYERKANSLKNEKCTARVKRIREREDEWVRER